MLSTPNWSAGDRHLLETAPELAPFIKKFTPCTLAPKTEKDYFAILIRGLIAQQLPPEVVNDLCRRINDYMNPPTPEKFVSITDKELLGLGLVQQKIDYLKNFSHMLLTKQVTLENFSEMTDAQITKQLLQVKGLGQWTIDMFLLLALCRTDIMPAADYTCAKALQNLFKLPAFPKRGQINKLTEAWRPWRSLAIWYLWQAAAELNKK